jgi:HEAT repeat protein
MAHDDLPHSGDEPELSSSQPAASGQEPRLGGTARPAPTAEHIAELADRVRAAQGNESITFPLTSSLRSYIHPSNIPQLLTMLDDPNVDVRVLAFSSLAHLGEASVPGLLAIIREGIRYVALDDAIDVLHWLSDTIRDPSLRAEIVDVLLVRLQDRTVHAQGRVARTLARYKDVRAIPVLIEALPYQRGQSKAEVAIALGKFGDRQAVPHLIDALQDEYSTPREAVLLALAALGDRMAVPSIIAALEAYDPDVRGVAAWALGELGDPQAVPALIAKLDDQVDFASVYGRAAGLARIQPVNGVAAHALNRIGTPEALAALDKWENSE